LPVLADTSVLEQNALLAKLDGTKQSGNNTGVRHLKTQCALNVRSRLRQKQDGKGNLV
jgi:hypothetical protein